MTIDAHSRAIFSSLIRAPLLAGDVPGAASFDRSRFTSDTPDIALNFEQKLGHLYEEALEGLIKPTSGLTLIASHQQIFDAQGQTLGELDFILHDQLGDLVLHLELAVKVYLAVQTPGGWSYPGPNASDNWHRKLKHMSERQLTMTRHPMAQKLLSEQYGITDIEPRQLIYGCLFMPIDQADEVPTPDYMAREGQRGKWLYASQWSDHFADSETLLIIPKPLWPVESSERNEVLLSACSARDLHSLAKTSCVMFTAPGGYQKYFLVPDAWPQA